MRRQVKTGSRADEADKRHNKIVLNQRSNWRIERLNIKMC
jgi:hypothetical protein